MAKNYNSVTIPKGITDRHYRYYRDLLDISHSKSKIELLNIQDIMKLVSRSIEEFQYYLKQKINRPINIIEIDKDKYIIEIINKKSKLLEFDLEDILEDYINKYAICEIDNFPETYVVISSQIIKGIKKKQMISICKSCGDRRNITDIGLLSKYYENIIKKYQEERKKKNKNK